MPSLIHSTAIVDPDAGIGDDVEIGPYCVIGAGATIGSRCRLHNHVTIAAGPIEIGEENQFFPYASIGQRTQDLKFEGEPTHLKIGNGNVFREFVTVNRATSPDDTTIIGNGGNFLAYSHVAHDCIVGDRVVLSNNGTLGGHVSLGNHAILGGLTAVHQFCRLGDHAFTGGCSKIVQDVPPFMVADGNPAKVRAVNAVGMQRHGFSDGAIRLVKRAHRKLYRDKLTASAALEAIEEMEADGDDSGVLRRIIDFVRASERGMH